MCSLGGDECAVRQVVLGWTEAQVSRPGKASLRR